MTAVATADGTTESVKLAVISPRTGVPVHLASQTGKALKLEFGPGACGVQAGRDGSISLVEAGHVPAGDNHITLV